MRERRIAFYGREHIRLNDPDIDPSCEDDIGDVLKGPLAGDRKDPKMISDSIKTGGKLGRFGETRAIHTFRYQPDEPGIYHLSHRPSRPMSLFFGMLGRWSR